MRKRRSYAGLSAYLWLMDKCNIESRRFVRTAALSAVLALSGLMLLPVAGTSGEKPADKPGAAWPVAVKAHYLLRYAGLEVGNFDMESNTAPDSYSLSGSGKVSVFFGSVIWSGSSTVSGSIEVGAPAPKTYVFNWRNNKKRGIIRMGYEDHVAAQVVVKPAKRVRADAVPLTPADKAALDPVSAIMILTKADGRPPCERRVGIFDGKQRYDIVLTPKRLTRVPPPSGGAPSEVAYVCRVMYVPVAGHRDDESTRNYAANRDVEVVLRRIPGSQMLIPYSVTVPTAWGTGSMVMKRIEVTTPTGAKVAFTD